MLQNNKSGRREEFYITLELITTCDLGERTKALEMGIELCFKKPGSGVL